MWWAEIVLATADGLGTNAIMKRTGKSKPAYGAGRSAMSRRVTVALMQLLS